MWHQKFIDKWGKMYVQRYLKNPNDAIKWAMGFFPSELIGPVVAAAHKELAKRGIKVK